MKPRRCDVSLGAVVLALIAAIGLAAAASGCATTASQTATAPGVADAPAAAYAAPASPDGGVAPDDPKVDETLGRLDSNVPSGCKQYVKAKCRAQDVPDVRRLETCGAYVVAINNLVKQYGASAVDTCADMAAGAARSR
jgi:hypothetical protein